MCRHRTNPHFINGKFRPLLKPSAAELVFLERMRTQLESHILAVNLMTCQAVSRSLLLLEPGCSLEWSLHISPRLWSSCKAWMKFLLWWDKFWSQINFRICLWSFLIGLFESINILTMCYSIKLWRGVESCFLLMFLCRTQVLLCRSICSVCSSSFIICPSVMRAHQRR